MTDDPDVLAVPRLFVPGGGSEVTLPELLGPPGLMAELLIPPVLAASEGTPVTPALLVPAEPGFGEPVALAGLEGEVVTPARPAAVEPPVYEPTAPADVPPVPPPALPPP
ncbi:MAG: hypothetical protein ACJ8EK_09965, partial [Bradyrhizobium sp.]